MLRANSGYENGRSVSTMVRRERLTLVKLHGFHGPVKVGDFGIFLGGCIPGVGRRR